MSYPEANEITPRIIFSSSTKHMPELSYHSLSFGMPCWNQSANRRVGWVDFMKSYMVIALALADVSYN